MNQKRTINEVWARFVKLLKGHAPETLAHIRPPASAEAIAEAEQRLGVVFPKELRQLYLLADGFAEGAFLLRDDYRILPLAEMAEASQALVGEPVTTYFLAGKVEVAKKVVRLLFACAKEANPDVSQISLRLRAKQSTVEKWFRERGMHTWEEVVDTHDSLTEWLGYCLEYYD